MGKTLVFFLCLQTVQDEKVLEMNGCDYTKCELLTSMIGT